MANKLVVNRRKKRYVMKFPRSRNYDIPAEMTMGGSDILEGKTKLRILGIIAQDDLQWQSQCGKMVSHLGRTEDESHGGAIAHFGPVLEE